MTYAEEEFFNAYDSLTKIISEDDFQALEHRFFRSYHATYEYIFKQNCIFIKCDEETLLVEIIFYNLEKKRVTESCAYRFTLCKVYYEWLGHFTELMFKESVFCEEKYSIVRVDHATEKQIEESMHKLENGDNPYQWG